MSILQIQTNLSRLGYRPGVLDGALGPTTEAAITAAGLDPDDLTGTAAALSMMVQGQRGRIPLLTEAQYSAFTKRNNRRGYPGWLPALNTFLMVAHVTEEALPFVLAQLAHESGGFRHSAEINGSSQRYAPYYGRGPIQLTWAENYAAAGDWMGLDLVSNPDLVQQPVIGFQAAAWYWLNTNLNRFSPSKLRGDAGDFVALTRAINGGTNGLEDRRWWLARAESLFDRGRAQATATLPEEPHVIDSPPARSPVAPAVPPTTTETPAMKTADERKANRAKRKARRQLILGHLQTEMADLVGTYREVFSDEIEDGADEQEAHEEALERTLASVIRQLLTKTARLKFGRDSGKVFAFVADLTNHVNLRRLIGKLFLREFARMLKDFTKARESAALMLTTTAEATSEASVLMTALSDLIEPEERAGVSTGRAANGDQAQSRRPHAHPRADDHRSRTDHQTSHRRPPTLTAGRTTSRAGRGRNADGLGRIFQRWRGRDPKLADRRVRHAVHSHPPLLRC